MRVTRKRLVCPKCGVRAVVPLTKALLAKQPDETTHVCHPAIGGCNHGFELVKQWRFRDDDSAEDRQRRGIDNDTETRF